MGEVISLNDKLESWKDSYTSPCGGLTIRLSSQGRIKLHSIDITMDLAGVVSMLSRVSEDVEKVLMNLPDA